MHLINHVWQVTLKSSNNYALPQCATACHCQLEQKSVGKAWQSVFLGQIKCMRRTDKDLLVKGIKSFMLTALTMFLAPIFIYQAFKNQENVLFWPVLVFGLALAALAIYLGFRSINIVMEAVFGKRKKS